ncbi:hypothetical protein [Mycolicibacterium sp. XJ1904]
MTDEQPSDPEPRRRGRTGTVVAASVVGLAVAALLVLVAVVVVGSVDGPGDTPPAYNVHPSFTETTTGP